MESGAIRRRIRRCLRPLTLGGCASSLRVIESVADDCGVPPANVDAKYGKTTAPIFDKPRSLGDVNVSMYSSCGDSLNGYIGATDDMEGVRRIRSTGGVDLAPSGR